MIVNNKYFLPPPENINNLKELFPYISTMGIGRPVDDCGNPVGPWTPELLAQEISGQGGTCVDLRTVQLWFQINDRGISASNIMRIAEVLGCGDPELNLEWRKTLSAANQRLAAERKARRKIPDANPTLNGHQYSKLVVGISRLITTSGSTYILMLVWGGWAILAVSASILGLDHVTYPAGQDLTKAVGFYGTPTWTIEKVILIPAYLLINSRAVMSWRSYRRTLESNCVDATWGERISSYKMAFVAIILVSAIVVFGLQWYGGYLAPLLAGSEASESPNWLRVTTNPIQLAPLGIVIPLSLLVGLYIGAVYWLCFSTLLLLYIAAQDFAEVNQPNRDGRPGQCGVENNAAGQALIVALYRTIICGILMSILIKVSVVYLDVDAQNFHSWLVQDLMVITGFHQQAWSFLGETQIARQTSFIFLFVIAFTAYLAIYKVESTMKANGATRFSSNIGLWAAPVFMTLSFVMIGAFVGFSIFLGLAILIGAWELFRPSLVFNSYSNDETHMMERKSQ